MTQRNLFGLCLLFAGVLAASCVKEEEAIKVTYENIKAETFSYGIASAEGGVYKPEFSYSYREVTVQGEDTLNAVVRKDVGAEVVFEVEDPLTVNAETGEVTIPVNPLTTENEYKVKATISVKGTKGVAEATVTQLAPGSEMTVSNLKIEEFTYEGEDVTDGYFASKGGIFTPTLKYSYNAHITWSNGKETDEILTSGASVSYSGGPEGASFGENGDFTLPVNPKIEDRSFKIKAVVTIDEESAESEKDFTQFASPEEIVETYTYQNPIVMAEHKAVYPRLGTSKVYQSTRMRDTLWLYSAKYTADIDRPMEGVISGGEYEYISNSTNGTATRNYHDQWNYEKTGGEDYNTYEIRTDDGHPLNVTTNIVGTQVPLDSLRCEFVSAKGVTIPVSGGELMQVNVYRSGKQDTTLVAKPEWSTELLMVKDSTYTQVEVGGEDFKWYEDRPIEVYEPFDVNAFNVSEADGKHLQSLALYNLNKNAKYEYTDADLPESNYSNGIWNIRRIGNFVTDPKIIVHRLVATVSDGDDTKRQTVEVYQNKNYPLGHLGYIIKIQDASIRSAREIYKPIYCHDDYDINGGKIWPGLGSDNKPIVLDEEYHWNAFSPLENTYCLSPDGNRDILVYFDKIFYKWYNPRIVYFTGGVSEEGPETFRSESAWERGAKLNLQTHKFRDPNDLTKYSSDIEYQLMQTGSGSLIPNLYFLWAAPNEIFFSMLFQPRGGMKAVAEADIPQSDGTTKHIRHEYKWVQDGDGYKGCYAIRLPYYEASAEFKWHVTYDFDLREELDLPYDAKNVNTGRILPLLVTQTARYNTNWEDFQLHLDLTYPEKLKTVKEFAKEHGNIPLDPMGRFLANTDDRASTWMLYTNYNKKDCRADYVDGVKRTRNLTGPYSDFSSKEDIEEYLRDSGLL